MCSLRTKWSESWARLPLSVYRSGMEWPHAVSLDTMLTKGFSVCPWKNVFSMTQMQEEPQRMSDSRQSSKPFLGAWLKFWGHGFMCLCRTPLTIHSGGCYLVSLPPFALPTHVCWATSLVHQSSISLHFQWDFHSLYFWFVLV